jgi:hypothetical protein
MATKAKNAGRSGKTDRPARASKGQSANNPDTMNRSPSDAALNRPGTLTDTPEAQRNGSQHLESGPSYNHETSPKSQQKPADRQDEEAMESFPASDPPARSHSTSPD